MAQLAHNFKKNQAMHGASYVAQKHGFEPGILGAQDMVRVVDDQHSLTVGFGSKPMNLAKAIDRAADWYVGFSIARRDLNEHLNLWLGEPEKVWYQHGTIAEIGKRVFVTEEPLEWSVDVPFEAAVDQIDAALDRLWGWADLAKIESQLYEPAGGKRRNVIRCVVNDALNGIDRVWDDYLIDNDRVATTMPERVRESRTNFDRHLREFKAKHPDGIPR